ncbi:Polysaccharide biosynthesis/export protein [Pseudooceanicola nitratireducens]|uniref:Polysaccharide biosynthesis/export protein n=1 Tax=Pseudooceanicola nitratireducens TaxID=517719 RepID=A0A1I1GZK4_9RHOB|nr:Polysaccharide biosynthesis/export protein [Pseudooceanicola nitratireducens]SFC17084.1 Polysaccharide biosynthesis/export protein [Pseudooceanicola nitratireducens]
MSGKVFRNGASGLALSVVVACAAPQSADNLEPVAIGGAYQAQYRQIDTDRDAAQFLQSATMNAAKCRPAIGGDSLLSDQKYTSGDLYALRGELLSRGDLVEFRLPEDETFSGDYVVSRDGTVKLPFIAPVPAAGRTPDQVAGAIRRALINDGHYAEVPLMSLLIKDLAPVRVGVSGAVFEARPTDIGGVAGDMVDDRRQAALGASTEGRNLSVALRSAGGIRPDADLSAVRLTRAGRNYTLDLRGVMRGENVDDVMLITGDEVHVPSRECFQDDLMKPSPISPPGISLYLSNLTQPATGNAPSAIGQTVREVPYGTRFMQAVVDANCVGGARATSADRSAALFSRNPVTGVSAVIERKVEVMRSRADRDDYDPYLLPGDAIACYDSGVTNLAEIGRVIGVIGAVSLLP